MKDLVLKRLNRAICNLNLVEQSSVTAGQIQFLQEARDKWIAGEYCEADVDVALDTVGEHWVRSES